jgi:hypothetical protein
MTDIERRLQVMLAARADQADPTLHGPDLRRLAEWRARAGRRTGLQALAAATVVAALAVGQQLLTGDGHHHAPTRAPAGTRGTTAPSTPSTRPPASSSTAPPTAPTTRPSPHPTRPSVRPSARSSASSVYVPPPAPRASARPHSSRATTSPSGA